MTRIQKGIDRYWSPLVVEAAGNTYDSADPHHRQYGDPDGYIRAWPTDEALKTLHTTASKALAMPPFIAMQRYNRARIVRVLQRRQRRRTG